VRVWSGGRDPGRRPLLRSLHAVRYLIDGMNVIGSRPDGWWRQRSRARLELLGHLGVLVRRPDVAEVTVVFDGRPSAGEGLPSEAHGVTARYAPGGRGAADDLIVELVQADPDAASLTVVTSDAALAARVRAAGAQVMSSGRFGPLVGR
jgi:predicted RNA-binding protein with PIN domain